MIELPREAGRRERRHAHLFSGEVDLASFPAQAPNRSSADADAELEQRVSVLEEQLAAVVEEIAALRRRLDGPPEG